MKRIGLAFVVLVLGVLGGVSYNLLTQRSSVPQLLTTVANCQLEQATCQASDSLKHQVEVTLSPKPVPVMETVQLQTKLSNFTDVTSIKVTITGVNMFMGYQYADLKPQNGQWQGTFTLPICTTQHMQWLAQVDIQTASSVFRADFPFNTYSSQPARPLATWLQENAKP